ncbi:MAG: CopG family transcriptional regulator [Clostridia bacterium]|nr:CopG family transcriptional regulator [Clostridia bacterium]
MKQEIRISKKSMLKGEDGHKVVSVRMREETMARLDDLSVQTNRSRNEVINLLLESALDLVTIAPEE